MEKSEQPNPIIELGRKIARDLGNSSRSDFLGGWMAHYIAELISEYETASKKNKDHAREKAFEAILKLWTHRYKSSSGFDAVKNAEPVLATLNQLNPNAEKSFYFSSRHELVKGANSDLKQLYEMAMGVDRTARRILKTILLAMAEASTGEDLNEYLKLASSVGGNDRLDSLEQLVTEATSEEFPNNFSEMCSEIRKFGELCVEFGKVESVAEKS